MKKLLTVILLSAAVSLGAFARGATWNFTAGATFPYSQLGYDGNDTVVSQMNYGGQGAITWIGNSGFTLRGSFAAGVATSKDISLSSEETKGAFQNLAFGLGFSPVNKNRTFLGFTGMFGMELTEYTYSYSKDVSGTNHDYTDAKILYTFSVGGDAFAGLRLTKHLGLYADVGARYIFVGADGTGSSDSYKKTDGTYVTETLPQSDPVIVTGRFIIQPSVGLVWTLR